MAGLTRGPLPAAVYWRRRLVLLVLVAGLVFAGYRLVGVVGGDPEGPAAAELVSGEQTSEPSTEPSTEASTEDVRGGGPTTPSEPSGEASERPTAVRAAGRRPRPRSRRPPPPARVSNRATSRAACR